VLTEAISTGSGVPLATSWVKTIWLAPPNSIVDKKNVCRALNPLSIPAMPKTSPKGNTPS
jgi:hypothetical protein